MTNLDIAKQKLRLSDLVPGTKKQINGEIFVNPCPVCGHKDHFSINPSKNLYHSYSGCCRGGSAIDYLVETRQCSNIKEAINYLFETTGTDKKNISSRQLVEMKKKRDKEKKIKEKKEIIIKKCYCKLTNFERLLRSFENKNFLENSLLTFIDNYTTRFIKTTDVNSLYSLCMNFKEEFDQWYDNYCWFEERMLNNEN